jgi:hypothetical protein
MNSFFQSGRDELSRIVRTHRAKKGVHGGNMVSPVAKRPDWVGIPVAGIERLMEHAAQAL